MFFKHAVTPKKRGIVSSVLVSAGLVVVTLIVLVAVVACPAANSNNGDGDTPIAEGELCAADGVACATGLECNADNVCAAPCDANDDSADCDNDTVANGVDNCPAVANADQLNTDNPDGETVDGDEFGDACDVDDDNDMVNDDMDIDDDNDGLIEINFLEDLDFMRHDLQGHSYTPGADASASTAGAPNATSGTACAEAADANIWLCGYELARNLNFADATSYTAGTINAAWRPTGGNATTATNPGFVPIGTDGSRFVAIFDGNGNTIANLYVNASGRGADDGVGLFGHSGTGSVLHDIGLASVVVRAGSNGVGGLVGHNRGTISASWSSGSVPATGRRWIGGLVGRSYAGSTIVASYSTASVSGNSDIGGLIGVNAGTIIAGYATGSMTNGSSRVGGLSGQLSGIAALGSTVAFGSWASGGVSGVREVGGLTGNANVIDASGDSYWDMEASERLFGNGSDDNGAASRDAVTTVVTACDSDSSDYIAPTNDMPLAEDNNIKNGCEFNELEAFGLTTEQMQAADGANFGGSNIAGRFGGCGMAYSFRSSTDTARYPRLRRYLGTGTTAADADITGAPATDCSNHVYHATELLAGQGQ